jgi:hypothetical protein
MITITSNGIVIGQVNELRATDVSPATNIPIIRYDTLRVADGYTNYFDIGCQRQDADWWISNVEYDYGDCCEFLEVVPMDIEFLPIQPLIEQDK